ncbi:MAG: DUF1343 domain-containing protein [Fidelibacterota bacterium]
MKLSDINKAIGIIFVAYHFTLCQSVNPQLNTNVIVGLEVLLNSRHELIHNQAITLVTNQIKQDHNFFQYYDSLFSLQDVEIKKIIVPKLNSLKKDIMNDSLSNRLQLYDLPEVMYLTNKTLKSLPEILQGITLILIDIQDIGTRSFSYLSIFGHFLEVAGELKIPVIVLDRPNPLGGIVVEGAVLAPDYKSSTSFFPLPIRHGLTMGELANMIVGEKWIDPIPELTIVKMENWTRDLYYDDTGLAWVNPSLKISDFETVFLFPGMSLLEATNVSFGQGTNQPYKLVGAPWLTYDLAKELMNLHLPGLKIKLKRFKPKISEGVISSPMYENQWCLGFKQSVSEKTDIRSVELGVYILYMIAALNADHFQFNSKKLNTLWGNDDLSELMLGRKRLKDLLETMKKDQETFTQRRAKYLLYP